ncbi:MAG TPA: ParB/Srx family N-terminal domain-containing protein, partial [Rhodanobacteraceae bacterium]|nr:ParB/Srx family N-terminal domain-containing protein [Rhodanobacteraceae bacterium]
MSGIFDIDTKGQRELDQRARLNPLDLSQPPAPGFFTNFFGGSGSGFMEGAANTGNLFLTAGHDARNLWNPTPADFGPDVDILHPPKTVQELTAPKTTLADLGRDAVDYWAPNPATTGTAGQVVGGFLQMAVPLMAGGGNPGLFVESGYLHTKQELEREGVDSATATRAGLIEGVVNLAGFKVPILGKTLLSRLATGAAGNVLFGAGASELQKVNLEAGGYDDLASQYNPADLKARAVDTLMGLAFGGLHHVMVPTRVKDAVLTATNAEHFEQSSLPDYDHATPGQQARGQHALEQALRQVLHGEPVDVADKLKPEDSARIERAMQGRTGYAEGIEPRKEGETDKAYAKRVIDQLPEPRPEQLPDQPDLYFTDTDVSSVIPLDKLESTKSAEENVKGGSNGLKRMGAAADGVLGKRQPISVRDNGDGTYTVLDGNGTLTAARKAGFEGIPVRVVEATVPGRPDVQARYDAAAKAYPDYVKTMTEQAEAVGGRFVNPGLKHVHRVLDKVDGEYGGDAGKITDLLRGTIEMPRPADVPDTVATLHAKFGKPIKPERNNLAPDSPPLDASGYRDYKGVFNVNGAPAEVQINIPAMLEAKATAHVPYEARQKIQRQLENEGRAPTPEERARIDELNQEMAAVFEPAWRLATSERKSFSQSGTPSSRNRLPENSVGGKELQSSVRPEELDTGAPSTTPKVVRGGNESGNESSDFQESNSTSDISNTSDASIPKSGADNGDLPRLDAAQTQAVAEAVRANPDALIPLEDADGNRIHVPASELLATATQAMDEAQTSAQAISAAASCAMRF